MAAGYFGMRIATLANVKPPKQRVKPKRMPSISPFQAVPLWDF